MGGRGGSSGAAGSGGGVDDDPVFEPTLRAIGAPCTTDADCPAAPNGDRPLLCIPSTSTDVFTGATASGATVTGGPEGGYCTAPCQATADCEELDILSACATRLGPGYCIAICQAGDGNIKCAGNDDVGARAQACVPPPPDVANQQVGACFPICYSDAGCGAGQFCDLGRSGLGLCSSTAPVGGDVGAPCTEATAETDCKSGLCLVFVDNADNEVASFCSAPCTFGLRAGCGFADDFAGPRDAICGQPQAADGTAGDIGFCEEACDTTADCTQAGWVCDLEILSEQGAAFFGRPGICQPPPPADAGTP